MAINTEDFGLLRMLEVQLNEWMNQRTNDNTQASRATSAVLRQPFSINISCQCLSLSNKLGLNESAFELRPYTCQWPTKTWTGTDQSITIRFSWNTFFGTPSSVLYYYYHMTCSLRASESSTLKCLFLKTWTLGSMRHPFTVSCGRHHGLSQLLLLLIYLYIFIILSISKLASLNSYQLERVSGLSTLLVIFLLIVEVFPKKKFTSVLIFFLTNAKYQKHD